MFNEEWRDLLLAFINSLKGKNGAIEMSIAENSVVKMKDTVELFWSDVGYNDPADETRQELFVEEDKEEEIVESDVEPIVDENLK